MPVESVIKLARYNALDTQALEASKKISTKSILELLANPLEKNEIRTGNWNPHLMILSMMWIRKRTPPKPQPVPFKRRLLASIWFDRDELCPGLTGCD